MADGIRQSVYQVLESTYGTTPATPSFTKLRQTGCTVALNRDSYTSEELRPDRQIIDHEYGMRQVGGDIQMELTSGGAIDDILEAVFLGTWATNVLKIGNTRRSYSIMRHFEDLTSGNNPYHIFKGCEYNTLSIENTSNDKTRMTASVIGQSADTPASTAPAGSVLGSATTSKMMNGLLGAVSEGGSGISIVTDGNFTLENGLETRPVIGSDLSLQPSLGFARVSGQVTAYFENSTLLEKFYNSTESSLSFTVQDADSNSFTFLFPRIKYTGGQADVSGAGAITIPLPFTGLYDATTENTSLKLTRA